MLHPLGYVRAGLLFAAFADRVGRLPPSMRPSPPRQRTNVVALWGRIIAVFRRRIS